jgi:hypothetical protein
VNDGRWKDMMEQTKQVVSQCYVKSTFRLRSIHHGYGIKHWTYIRIPTLAA